MLYFVGNVIAIISSEQESDSFLQISELKKKLFGYETVPPTPKKSGDSNIQSQEEIYRYESLTLLLLKHWAHKLAKLRNFSQTSIEITCFNAFDN